MRLNPVLLVLLLALYACVDEVKAPILRSERVLVVDATVTNEAKRHSVKLTYSSMLDESLELSTLVTGATVRILVAGTVMEPLEETAPGVYETREDFAANVNDTYQLLIETAEGRKYESATAVMKESGSLTNVYFEFHANSINPNDLTKPQHAILVYVDGVAHSSDANLLRWRWRATYQVHTNPKERVRYTIAGPVPDPPPCSGWGLDEDGAMYHHGPCTCCDCWVTFYSETSMIGDPGVRTATAYNKVLVATIPFMHEHFYDKLLVQVDQLTLTEDVYTFWKLVKAQQESADNIFQPNIVRIKGNIASVSDPDEVVFGIFSVAASVTNQVSIRGTDIPLPVNFPEEKDDCRRVGGGTNIRPDFY